MNWDHVHATGGETTITVTLTETIHADAMDSVLAFVNGVKWADEFIDILATSVAVNAPWVGWEFGAGDIVEIGYWPADAALPTPSTTGYFEISFAALLEQVSVYAPSRAANATYGLNDPTYSAATTYYGVFEELDSAQQIAAYGTLVGRAAKFYSQSDNRSGLEVDYLVKRSTGDVYRVMTTPVVPNPRVIDHCEVDLEWLPKPPTLT